MTQKLIAAVVFSALFGLFFSCSDDKGEEVMESDVVITVNGDPIYLRELQLAWSMLSDADKKDYSGPEGLRKLLDELVVYKLMSQKAKAQGLDKMPAIQQQVEMYRQSILVNALLDKSVTDEDINNYYQRHFIHGLFVLVKVSDPASDKAWEAAGKKADGVHKELTADGVVFEEAARRLFEESGDVVAGDIGYVTHDIVEGKAGFAAAEALFGLTEPGQVSRPVKGVEGFFIFQLLEPPGSLDPKGLSMDMIEVLRDQRRDEIIRSHALELKTRDDNEVVVNEKILQELVEVLAESWKKADEAKKAADGSTVEPLGGSTAEAVPIEGGTP